MNKKDLIPLVKTMNEQQAEIKSLRKEKREIHKEHSERHKDLKDQMLKAAALIRKKEYRKALTILEANDG